MKSMYRMKTDTQAMPSFANGEVHPAGERPSGGRRTWLTRDEESASTKPAREGGTLFERMSNIARGAAKAQVDEQPEAPRMRSRDPLDIPRFLNRQNNQ